MHVPETPSSYSLHQRWMLPNVAREWNKRVRWMRHLRFERLWPVV